jgi:redox-regulated HSP33 family molecular chaperone
MSKLKENMKSPTKRSRFKYPALEKSANLKTRQEEIDDIKSYFDKLSPEEKDWMNRFVEEEVHANLNHDGPKLNKSKKDKKRIYNKNNARNRCIYTKEKAKGMLKNISSPEELEEIIHNGRYTPFAELASKTSNQEDEE